MLNFKTFLIATAMIFLALAGFVNSSDAFEIVEMYPRPGEYTEEYRGYLNHTAYVKTSEPYYTVEWYVDDVYQNSSYGDSNNPITEAYFSPYWLEGSIDGTTYTIKAVAYSMDANTLINTDSYTLTVYRPTYVPKVDAHIGANTGVSGEATIWYMGWAGRTASLLMTAGCTNDTDDDVPCWIKLDYEVVELDSNGRQKSVLYRPTAIFLNFRLDTGEKDGRARTGGYTLAPGRWAIDKTFRVEGTATAYAGNEPIAEENDKWEVADGVKTTIRF